MKIGIIDLGTLSLRFDVYGDEGDEPTLRHRSMPRLGDLVFRDGVLGPAGKARLIAELEAISALVREHQVERIAAVGTSVFRDAQDAADVLQEVERTTGIPLQILSGLQEAELTARGILARERNLPPRFVCVDIGGGSTEMTWCEEGEALHSVSLDLGVIRLREKFFPDFLGGNAPLTVTQIEDARSEIQKGLDSIEPLLRRFHPSEMIGSSGTIRALERLGWVSEAQDFRLSIAELRTNATRFLSFSPEMLLAASGVERGRADVIMPGMLLLLEFTAAVPVDQLRVSHFSLRHGILDLVRQNSHLVRWIEPSRS